MAASAGLAGAGLACAGRPRAGGSPLAPAPANGTAGLSRALILGTSGATPHDTAVTFPAGEHRTIVLRHAPPDNLVFAAVDFPPRVFAADSGHEVTVRLHAHPGVYGLDIATSTPAGPGVTVTFQYPRYFSASPQARQAYGSDVLFERALAIARLQSDSTLTFLTSRRPAPDHLQAELPSAGSYVVAAAR